MATKWRVRAINVVERCDVTLAFGSELVFRIPGWLRPTRNEFEFIGGNDR